MITTMTQLDPGEGTTTLLNFIASLLCVFSWILLIFFIKNKRIFKFTFIFWAMIGLPLIIWVCINANDNYVYNDILCRVSEVTGIGYVFCLFFLAGFFYGKGMAGYGGICYGDLYMTIAVVIILLCIMISYIRNRIYEKREVLLDEK